MYKLWGFLLWLLTLEERLSTCQYKDPESNGNPRRRPRLTTRASVPRSPTCWKHSIRDTAISEDLTVTHLLCTWSMAMRWTSNK
uniref:Putative secreted protein n=1 Tax=Ixodes ricinus TaxID=34613 RepID=A0A6B0UEI9_IXORI